MGIWDDARGAEAIGDYMGQWKGRGSISSVVCDAIGSAGAIITYLIFILCKKYLDRAINIRKEILYIYFYLFIYLHPRKLRKIEN